MAFETAIARVSWPIEKRRDVDAMYNPRTVDQLVAYAPGFDWQAFLDSAELGSRKDVMRRRAHRGSRHREARSAARRSPRFKDYLTFHHLNAHAPYLPKRFDDARFAFYGIDAARPAEAARALEARRGRGERRARRAGGAGVRREVLPAGVEGEDGSARREPADAPLGERIDALAWMTPETKKRAHEKLATFVTKIGYPDKWKDYSALEVQPRRPARQRAPRVAVGVAPPARAAGQARWIATSGR